MTFLKTLVVLACLTSGGALAQTPQQKTQPQQAAQQSQATSLEEQYVYLATIQHLVKDVSPDMLDALRAISRTAMTRQSATKSVESLDAKLNDPLLLQADPASIVAIATGVIEMGLDRQEDIQTAMTALEKERPEFLNPSLQLAVLENGVRFRFALAQAMYAVDLRELPRPQQAAAELYGEGTYALRDEMEVLDFEIAVDGMADDAIGEQRTAFAALQRGIIDEIDPYSFEEDAKRASQMSAQSRRSIAMEMRNMYLQIALLVVLALP
jgi:hypothetical protein